MSCVGFPGIWIAQLKCQWNVKAGLLFTLEGEVVSLPLRVRQSRMTLSLTAVPDWEVFVLTVAEQSDCGFANAPVFKWLCQTDQFHRFTVSISIIEALVKCESNMDKRPLFVLTVVKIRPDLAIFSSFSEQNVETSCPLFLGSRDRNFGDYPYKETKVPGKRCR